MVNIGLVAFCRPRIESIEKERIMENGNDNAFFFHFAINVIGICVKDLHAFHVNIFS